MSVVDQDDGQYSEPESGGNFLTKKMGPLPIWAWAVIGVAGGYILLKKTSLLSSLGGSGSSTSSGTNSGSGSTDTGSTGTIDSSGNANDVLTALESMLSTDAADITALKTVNAKQQKSLVAQEKQIKALQKKGKKVKK